MTTKFTPAPWHVERADSNTILIKANNSSVMRIVHPHMDKEAEANAALIKTAPDLYDALVCLLSVIPDNFDLWEDASQARQIERAKNLAKQAIKDVKFL